MTAKAKPRLRIEKRYVVVCYDPALDDDKDFAVCSSMAEAKLEMERIRREVLRGC